MRVLVSHQFDQNAPWSFTRCRHPGSPPPSPLPPLLPSLSPSLLAPIPPSLSRRPPFLVAVGTAGRAEEGGEGLRRPRRCSHYDERRRRRRGDLKEAESSAAGAGTGAGCQRRRFSSPRVGTWPHSKRRPPPRWWRRCGTSGRR